MTSVINSVISLQIACGLHLLNLFLKTCLNRLRGLLRMSEVGDTEGYCAFGCKQCSPRDSYSIRSPWTSMDLYGFLGLVHTSYVHSVQNAMIVYTFFPLYTLEVTINMYDVSVI